MAVSLALAPVCARAQRPEDVAAAGTAFREGQSAQLAGEYARAAELFELADDTAPSPAALRSAIRNRQAAGHASRAATLAAEAIARYPDDAETRALAEGVIAALGAGLYALHLRCALECTAAIDGRAVRETPGTSFEVYLDPGAHTLVASWAGRESVTRAVEASAGGDVTIELEAPPAAVADVAPLPEPTPPAPAPVPAPGDRGLTPVVFAVGAGLTAVSAGILVWSGLDVLSARDAYVALPSESAYLDGVGRETRTNVLVGVTAGLAAATLVVALFTDFGGGAGSAGGEARAAATVLPTLSVDERGAVVGAAGTF